VRRERRLANQRTPLSPEERHLQVPYSNLQSHERKFSGSKALATKIRLIDSLKLASEALNVEFLKFISSQ
jgi:hypothetical protein